MNFTIPGMEWHNPPYNSIPSHAPHPPPPPPLSSIPNSHYPIYQAPPTSFQEVHYNLPVQQSYPAYSYPPSPYPSFPAPPAPYYPPPPPAPTHFPTPPSSHYYPPNHMPFTGPQVHQHFPHPTQVPLISGPAPHFCNPTPFPGPPQQYPPTIHTAPFPDPQVYHHTTNVAPPAFFPSSQSLSHPIPTAQSNAHPGPVQNPPPASFPVQAQLSSTPFQNPIPPQPSYHNSLDNNVPNRIDLPPLNVVPSGPASNFPLLSTPEYDASIMMRRLPQVSLSFCNINIKKKQLLTFKIQLDPSEINQIFKNDDKEEEEEEESDEEEDENMDAE